MHSPTFRRAARPLLLTLCALFGSTFLFPLLAQTNWTDIGQGAVPRSEATAISYQGDYYMFNGFDGRIDIYDRVEKYDPRTNTYTSLAPMPTVNGKRTAVTHNGIALVDDVIWIVGGRVDDHPGRVTDEVWLYNISEDSWSKGPTLPARRGGGGVGRLGRTLHYVGGFDENAQCDVADHLMYDLDNPAAGWQDLSATSPMPEARNHFAAVVLDGKLYTVGGQNGHDGCGGGADNKLVHAYDPATDTWSRIADLPAKQSHAEPSTFAHNGKILSVGGAESGGRGVWEYDPTTDEWTVLDNLQLPQALLAPVSRVHEDKLFVLNGGSPNVQNPTISSRTKTFVASTKQVLSFNPSQLTATLQSGERETLDVVLSNLNGELEVPFTIDRQNLPAWLSLGRTSVTARESFAEVELALDATDLGEGIYSYTLEAKAANYQSATLTVELTIGAGSPTPNEDVSLYLEAECGIVGTNWQTVSSASASGEAYVAPQPGKNATGAPPEAIAANLVTFELEVPETDDYRLHARVDAPSSNADSYWVRLNGGDWIRWWQGLGTTGGFAWREISGSPFSLPAGSVTIDFAYREDGTLLDKLFLTNTSTQPGGLGGQSLNCDSAPPVDPPTTTAIRINAGGPALTHEGNDFVADASFSGGKVYTNSKATVPSLYQSERSSEAPYQYSYSVAVPNGTYRVRLHFAEIYFGATGGGTGGVGKRIFDVTLEDDLVLDNFDINAEVGPQMVTIEEFDVTVTDGTVDLFLDASPGVGGVNQPKLSALEIIGDEATTTTPAITDFWLEAECSQTGSDWTISGDTKIANSAYLAFPGKGNLPVPTANDKARQLTYSVELTASGSYALFFRMNTPSAGENSFWVSVDGGKWIKFWREVTGDQLLTQGFEWREVNDDAQPLNLQLAAGQHTIRIAPREVGTQLDRIYLGKSGSAPNGLGNKVADCTFSKRFKQPISTIESPTLLVYPNPVRDRLQFTLSGLANGRVEAQLFDLNGRLLQRSVYEVRTGQTLSEAMDVTNLPPGSYVLKMVGASVPTSLNRGVIKVH